MKKFTAESHRHLLIVLFYLFEAILLASLVTASYSGPRTGANLGIINGTNIAYWYSFVGQLIVCSLLRRTARRLAVIGWITLFASLLFCGLFLTAVA
jgi:hypothetical protein